jgi:dCTP deaminase
MYLSDGDIKRAVKAGEIILSNFDESRLSPASYDILLGDKFMITDTHSIDAIDPVQKKYAATREVILKKGETFTLHPGVSILGVSRDYFGSQKYLVQLHGKSSLARIGLMVHNTAGLINPGHFLYVTFELCNLNSVPIVLTPGMRIGQLTFSQMLSEPSMGYRTTSKYVNQNWKVDVPREKSIRKKVKKIKK